jgi:hypothetical protein
LNDVSSERFSTRARMARSTRLVTGAMVVSKPMARNTTSRSGSALASSSAARGE